MIAGPSLLERAYELVKTCSSMAEIARRLTTEGYTNVNSQLASPGMRRELRAAMRRHKRERNERP